MPFGSPLLDSGGVKTLEESGTMQRVWDRLKEEGDILPFSTSPTLTTYSALTEVTAVIEDGTTMVQESCSMDLEKQRVLPLRKESSIHWSIWRPLMLTLAKIRRFFLYGSSSWEANFQKSPLLFEHEKLHDGHGSTLEDEFGMGDVKGEEKNM